MTTAPTTSEFTGLWAWLRVADDGSLHSLWAVLYPGLGPSPLVATNEDDLRRITEQAEMMAGGRWPGELVLWEFKEGREVRRIGGPETTKAPRSGEPGGA